MSFEIVREYAVKGIYLEVYVDAEIGSIGNDGIGSYEFWGARGFDKGHDYVEDFTVEGVTVFQPKTSKGVKPSARLLKVLTELIDKDYESICEELMEKQGDYNEGMQDYYDDMRYEESRGN